MGDIRGFMKYRRQDWSKQPTQKRTQHWQEFLEILPDDQLREQGHRCMDCGVPFCHTGCPLGNLIPDFNDLVARGKWREALEALHSTNNFPEFTGRICPAPCENACVLGINDDPVTIEQIEHAIADRGFEEGWIQPEAPLQRTDKRVAIIGSGPAGLAAAQQLNRAGHRVTIFERDPRPGGLLTYGIPDFKLGKDVVQRRVEILVAEGIELKCGVHVGRDLSLDQLRADFDAILLATGARQGRDLEIPGRQLQGVHFAMEYLDQQNKRNAGELPPDHQPILATGKDVIVIGGGDTGSDCVGTANRHKANSITQFQIHNTPPNVGPYPRADQRPMRTPWPEWTHMLRTSSSHEEGCDRHWCILTKEFVGDDQGRVTGLKTVSLEWADDAPGQRNYREIPGSEKIWPTQLVLIAIGFAGLERQSVIEQLGVDIQRPRGNVITDDRYQTSIPGVFCAGDQRRGQSLVVWAIQEGREAARCIDLSLMGTSSLPSNNDADYHPAGLQSPGQLVELSLKQ